MGFVTLHEMFHIFQNSHISTDDFDVWDEVIQIFNCIHQWKKIKMIIQNMTYLGGMRVFYNSIHISYLDYARETNDPSWFKDEMECTLSLKYQGIWNKIK